jgi:hypothetical protein
MSYFVKDNRHQDRKSPESNLLDDFYQNRLIDCLFEHEYGKARENTRWREETPGVSSKSC